MTDDCGAVLAQRGVFLTELFPRVEEHDERGRKEQRETDQFREESSLRKFLKKSRLWSWDTFKYTSKG